MNFVSSAYHTEWMSLESARDYYSTHPIKTFISGQPFAVIKSWNIFYVMQVFGSVILTNFNQPSSAYESA